MGMAKRRYSKKGNKIEPSVLTLSITTAPVTPAGIVTQYLDLSQVASLVNRRFYRQGINWAVAGIKVLNLPGFTGQIQVSKLPNTWVMSNAWEKGMRAWTRMNRDALEEAPSVKPRFLDFKVFADHAHAVAGVGANLLPVSGAGATATPGEWSMSKFQIPDSTDPAGAAIAREILATGGNYPGNGASGFNSVSLIEGYAASRALPNVLDPNTPDDMHYADGPIPQNWITAIFNEGTEQDTEVLDDMALDNNIAPYPFENDGTAVDTQYPGGANQLVGLEIHSFEFITATTVGGTTRIKGGNFPCGLIRFDMSNTGEANVLKLEIDLIPGNHRGYLCEPMTEM
jgi:hypothetical protein